jgi:hypothetical protein
VRVVKPFKKRKGHGGKMYYHRRTRGSPGIENCTCSSCPDERTVSHLPTFNRTMIGRARNNTSTTREAFTLFHYMSTATVFFGEGLVLFFSTGLWDVSFPYAWLSCHLLTLLLSMSLFIVLLALPFSFSCFFLCVSHTLSVSQVCLLAKYKYANIGF